MPFDAIPAAPAAALRAFPRPGRLALHASVPELPARAMAVAGRQALGRLRAAVLEHASPSAARRLLARLRGPAGTDLASLAVHAAEGTRPDWDGSDRLVVTLHLGNGDAALTLSWWREDEQEMLRWSARGAVPEDGACFGSAAVAAALRG
jgi:hypothetical protein